MRSGARVGSLPLVRSAAADAKVSAAAFAPAYRVFNKIPRQKFGAILTDIPTTFQTWSNKGKGRSAERHYKTMSIEQIAKMPVGDLAAENCVLFFWITWPQLKNGLRVIEEWGFRYRGSAFDWMKADNTQVDFFDAELEADMKMGYWTRQNTEPCLLATRGKPKRLNADVRQGIIAPAREHSRKPDGVHERISRLVGGPYIELFSRQRREGWSVWGNEIDRFAPIVRRE